jgi:dihydrodipicolinate synthase/N-acetylneuraminate lyase
MCNGIRAAADLKRSALSKSQAQSAPNGSAAVIVGVVPVLETPFDAAGEVDLDGFVRVVDHVLATGVRAVMFPGFASEFHKLSDEERHLLTGALLERTRHRRDVTALISIPDHATHLATRAARRAVAAGADAINVLPPFFLAPSEAEVRQHLEAIIQAVDPTPVVVQYAPALTGLSLSTDLLVDLAASHDNFRTVKVESVPPGPMVTALSNARPHLDALVGYGGLHMIDALRRGAVGVQPGCSFTELYLAIWVAWETGRRDEAAALHHRLLPYLGYWMQSAELMVQVEKTVSMRRGLIASDACRRPGRTLDRYEVESIQRFLTEFSEFLPSPSLRI